jgi:hypothetical protein
LEKGKLKMIVGLQKFNGIALPFVLFAALFASSVSAQTPVAPPNTSKLPVATPVLVPYKVKNKEAKSKKQIVNENSTAAEKSIKVDAKVNISLCVSEGKIHVNGWDRNEIRAYVSGGSEVGFDVLQKSKQAESAVWVMVLGFDPAKNKDASADECLSGDEIELDVPRGATVNIKGRESETTIESIWKAKVENVSGDIFLNDIQGGIEATTYEGGVTVGKSSGAMNLTSNLGNIVAYEVSPSEIGDVFKAKTINGMITLDQIEHRQIDAGSNSGSIKFTGEFVRGGRYNFGTSSGSVLLILPEKTSCSINAVIGFGQFSSEIPLSTENISNPGGVKSLTGLIGGGDATLMLKTYNGRLNIRKQ